MLSDVNKLFVFKSLLTIAQQCFAFTPQANFTAHNLNFHWRLRWWDQIQAISLNIFYFTTKVSDNQNYKWHFINKLASLCSTFEGLTLKPRIWILRQFTCTRPDGKEIQSSIFCSLVCWSNAFSGLAYLVNIHYTG